MRNRHFPRNPHRSRHCSRETHEFVGPSVRCSVVLDSIVSSAFADGARYSARRSAFGFSSLMARYNPLPSPDWG
jgi:hypothetical protein